MGEFFNEMKYVGKRLPELEIGCKNTIFFNNSKTFQKKLIKKADA